MATHQAMWRLKHWPTRRLTRYQRQKLRHFGKTVGDVKAEALLDILADTLGHSAIKILATNYVR